MPNIPDLSHGIVTGRFLSGIADNSDEDAAPNALAMKGFVEFTATEKVLRIRGADGPVTVFPGTLKVGLDSEGYLTHNGSRQIALWATDDPDVDVPVWHWRAKLALSAQQAEGDSVWASVMAPVFDFAPPSGETIDLATVERLDTSPART